MIDQKRLLRLFGPAELSPLLARMRSRMERGHALSGTIVLADLGPTQVAAVAELIGRPPARTGERFISVPLDELRERLAAAGICNTLEKAVELLTGPVVNRPDERAARESAWDQVFARAPKILRDPPLDTWLECLKATGVLKRLARSSPAGAHNLLVRLGKVMALLPARGEPLATIAAAALGDSHALDPGTPAATLAVRLAAQLGGIQLEDDAEGRRAAWASAGVLCDELSNPALVLNLLTGSGSPLGRILGTAAAAGEPVHVSLRLLLRHPLAADSALRECAVFVCENPSVVAMAAARLGPRCAPLVCANGQPATPVQVLLRQLQEAGSRLWYHGDFDGGGLRIASLIMNRFAARPWRMASSDYLLAARHGRPFSGVPGPTPWDPGLSAAMTREGRAVHEELVAPSLLGDLAVHAGAVFPL